MSNWNTEVLAKEVGKILGVLYSNVPRHSRVVILIQHPDGTQFIGSDVPAGEVAKMFRETSDKYDANLLLNVEKIVDQDGNEVKSGGSA